MRLFRMLSIIPVLLLSLVLVGTAAASNNVECRATLGAVTVDNVIVPSGAACTLNGTIVRENVKVSSGATLTANAVNVTGSLQADGAELVTVNAGTFGQNIDIKRGNRARVDQAQVSGNLKLEENRGAVSATANRVGFDLRAERNRGGVTLTNNRVGLELRCRENNPAPTGGGNTAQRKRDQCSRL